MTEYGTINWMFDEINGIPTLYWILILAAAIIGFIILFFIAYYIIYKIRINKALKKEKHIGKPLISPLGVAVASGAVVWIASTVFIIAMLHLLAGISYQNSEYISDNYRNIISLQQQLFFDKITDSYTFTVGKIDAKSKTAELTVELYTALIPGKNDKISFRIGDNETELHDKGNGKLTGTVRVSLFNDAPSGILTFESGNDRITQILSSQSRIFNNYTDQPETIDESQWLSCIPHAEFDTSLLRVSSEGDKKRLEGDITISDYPAEADKDIVFTDMTLVFEVSGRSICKAELMKDNSVKHSENLYTYTLNESIEDGNIVYYLLATDTEGNKYKLYDGNGYFQYDDSFSEDHDTEDNRSIYYDKDGKTVRYLDSY